MNETNATALTEVFKATDATRTGKVTEKEAAADPASRLAAMSLEQLLAKAADSGLSAEEVDEIDDEGDPKAALIALLLPLELAHEGEADA